METLLEFIMDYIRMSDCGIILRKIGLDVFVFVVMWRSKSSLFWGFLFLIKSCDRAINDFLPLIVTSLSLPGRPFSHVAGSDHILASLGRLVATGGPSSTSGRLQPR